MSHETPRRWWPIAALLTVLAVGFATGVTIADDESKAADKAPNDDVVTETDGTPVDPFAVPDGTVEELVDFMIKVAQQPVLGRTDEARAEHLVKVHNAIVTACDKILAHKDLDKTLAGQAAGQKISSLSALARHGVPGAKERLAKAAAEFAQSDNGAVVNAAQFQLLVARLNNLERDNREESAALVKDVAKYLADGPLTYERVQIAQFLARILEMQGQLDLAAEACQSFGKTLVASDNRRYVQAGEDMLASLKRFKLVGHPVKVTGTLVDGKEFDWSKYKGKVVLIDFWATWCGPCMQELPNVLENYEKYHDRGFEVVGISMDEDRQSLEGFLGNNELPWEVLFSDNPQVGGFNHPLAREYGIVTIPTVWLVDRQGNVVSLGARGPELGRLLAEMLGEPVGDDAAAGGETKS